MPRRWRFLPKEINTVCAFNPDVTVGVHERHFGFNCHQDIAASDILFHCAVAYKEKAARRNFVCDGTWLGLCGAERGIPLPSAVK